MLTFLSDMPLISADSYERFLRDIGSQIDSADREMKEKAENTLKAIADNYQKLILERLAHELDMIDQARATGDSAAIDHHRALAEIYKSMAD
jgi:hypothetical protein